ncbi:MAG TPA: hypothetical protein VJR05_11485 [Acidimicrobiia bacterium]|nr:hypothetical protein [Acidimicrobiia bacterium]
MNPRSRLESMLFSLANSIDWPTPHDQATSRVMARIEPEPTAPRRIGWNRPLVTLAGMLLVSFVLVLSPSARQAVADLLNAAGVRISFTSFETPTTGASLNLGEPVDLNAVQAVVDFEVRAPRDQGLGPPDAVYVSESGQVTMVWAGSPTLPAARDTGIGLLLAQYRVDGQDLAQKSLGPETQVQAVMVEGQPGLWVEGAAHTFTLLDAEGNPIEETTRLAANVLLWDAEGVSHRLETTGDLQTALTIAEALEPLP